MEDWRSQFSIDPVLALLSSGNGTIEYFAKGDLLEKEVSPPEWAWDLPEVQNILKRQLEDGSFKCNSKKPCHPPHHHALVETWKQLRFLVEKYRMTRKHTALDKACRFIISCQTKDGDIRGMIGDQYATYYTGAMLGLLIKAGYEGDIRIEKGMQWLLSMRQDDGGWTIPMLTHYLSGKEQYRITAGPAKPLEPDRTQPFSHNWTGMVLRAFAAHPKYRNSPKAKKAGELLKSRFFQKDSYTSYQKPDYWVRFNPLYWWNNLLTALTTLNGIGFTRDDQDIKRGLEWFVKNQEDDGLWKIDYAKGKKITDNVLNRERRLWVGLDVCRMFERYYY